MKTIRCYYYYHYYNPYNTFHTLFKDLGDPLLGEAISIDIADYIAVPDMTQYVVWHKESPLPEVELVTTLWNKDGNHFGIHHLTKEDYGIYACELFSSEDYFLAKKRFQIGNGK